jgi:magnesium-transporting ATPase (P-type)
MDIVYISTMNLDGETNLKERYLITKQVSEDNIQQLDGKIECEYPNESLEKWDGNMIAEVIAN